MDDRKLLRRIARGDDAAFSAFYRAHLNAVVAFLAGACRTPSWRSTWRRRRSRSSPRPRRRGDLERVEERSAAGGVELDRALAALPEPIRRALLARVVDERDYDEIAAELECSEQLVRQRAHRGLTRLRAGLEER